MAGIERTLVVEKGGKYGLYNSVSKSLFVDPIYVSIEAFGKTYNDGYLFKDENGKYGIIGSEGKVILANTYDKVFKATGSDKYVVTDGLKTKLISQSY